MWSKLQLHDLKKALYTKAIHLCRSSSCFGFASFVLIQFLKFENKLKQIILKNND